MLIVVEYRDEFCNRCHRLPLSKLRPEALQLRAFILTEGGARMCLTGAASRVYHTRWLNGGVDVVKPGETSVASTVNGVDVAKLGNTP